MSASETTSNGGVSEASQSTASRDSAYESPDLPKRRRSTRNSARNSSNGSDTGNGANSSTLGSDQRVSSTSSGSERKLRRVRKNPKPKRRTPVQEIEHLQGTTHLLIPRRPFQRVVREIVQKYKENAYIQSKAFDALQESAEIYMAQLFEDASMLTAHRQRSTLQVKDITVAQFIRKEHEFYVTKHSAK